jgi:hypothetical protein
MSSEEDTMHIAKSIMTTLVSGSEHFDISFNINGARIRFWSHDTAEGHIITMNVNGVNEPFAFMKFNGIIMGPYTLP